MKQRIEVHSQAEFDLCVKAGNIAIVTGCSVEARGNSSVVARENSSVVARENSSVEAWENSSVEARENSSVEARDNSSVEARENSSVVARENSSVVARGNSSVVARENSSVEARENSSVEARENSSVVARGNSSVEAWENSSVEARENSSVEARDNSSVEARENSSVEARDNSSVEAWENSSVEARDNSSVVARENSSVVARENSSVVARGNSSVEAWENSSVEARDNSSVEAWGNVFVRLFSAFSIKASIHVAIMRHGDAQTLTGGRVLEAMPQPQPGAEWCEYYGIDRATSPLVIPNIDAAILASIEANKAAGTNGLDMSSWHAEACDETNWCKTTHCRAGYAICLVGKAGFELERKFGSETAGKMIYAASRPDKPIPDFHATNQAAMADIRACAAEQAAKIKA